MYMYYNFCCRKCRNIIAIEQEIESNSVISGRIFSNKIHKNCSHKINDDEKIFADLISKSETLIDDVVDVIPYKKG